MAILEGTTLKIALITLAGIGILFAAVLGWLLFRYIKIKRTYSKYTVLIHKRKKDEYGNEYPVFVGQDRGAILKDKKTKKWVFHLLKNNVDLGEEEADANLDENRQLDLPSIPSELGGEVVYLEKLGPKKFAVGDPVWFEGTVKVKVSEADMAEALRVYDVNARFFSKDNSQLISFIVYAVVAVLILILVATVLQKFEILVEVADKLDHAAQVLSGGKQVAVPSGAPA